MNSVNIETDSASGAPALGSSASTTGGKILAITQKEWTYEDEQYEEPWTYENEEWVFAINDAGEKQELKMHWLWTEVNAVNYEMRSGVTA